MHTAKIFLQAARAMSRYRLRTLLMMLGVLIGISSLAVLTAIGEGTKRQTMQRFKNMMGTFDTIIVRPGGARFRGMPTLVNVPQTLKFDDARAIANELGEAKAVAEMQTAFDIDVKYRDKSASPAVFGVSSNWTALRDDEVADGRGISDEDVRSLARVAVIGADVNATLFAEENPIGRTVRIAEVPFQIVGILASRGAGPGGGRLDRSPLGPWTGLARDPGSLAGGANRVGIAPTGSVFQNSPPACSVRAAHPQSMWRLPGAVPFRRRAAIVASLARLASAAAAIPVEVKVVASSSAIPCATIRLRRSNYFFKRRT